MPHDHYPNEGKPKLTTYVAEQVLNTNQPVEQSVILTSLHSISDDRIWRQNFDNLLFYLSTEGGFKG